MRPRKIGEGSCGPLLYQTREKPYTHVRNLTDITQGREPGSREETDYCVGKGL